MPRSSLSTLRSFIPSVETLESRELPATLVSDVPAELSLLQQQEMQVLMDAVPDARILLGADGSAFERNAVEDVFSIAHEDAMDFEGNRPFSLAAKAAIGGDIARYGEEESVTLIEKGRMAETEQSYGLSVRPGVNKAVAWLQARPWQRLYVRVIAGVDMSQEHIYAVTYDGKGDVGGLKITIDGVPKEVEYSENSLNGNGIRNTEPLTIGAGHYPNLPQHFAPARVTGAAVAPRVLSTEEMNRLFPERRAAVAPDPALDAAIAEFVAETGGAVEEMPTLTQTQTVEKEALVPRLTVVRIDGPRITLRVTLPPTTAANIQMAYGVADVTISAPQGTEDTEVTLELAENVRGFSDTYQIWMSVPGAQLDVMEVKWNAERKQLEVVDDERKCESFTAAVLVAECIGGIAEGKTYDAGAAALESPALRAALQEEAGRLTALWADVSAAEVVLKGYPQLTPGSETFLAHVSAVGQDMGKAKMLMEAAAAQAFGSLLAVRTGGQEWTGAVEAALATQDGGVAWVLGQMGISAQSVKQAVAQSFDAIYDKAVQRHVEDLAAMEAARQEDIAWVQGIQQAEEDAVAAFLSGTTVVSNTPVSEEAMRRTMETILGSDGIGSSAERLANYIAANPGAESLLTQVVAAAEVREEVMRLLGAGGVIVGETVDVASADIWTVNTGGVSVGSIDHGGTLQSGQAISLSRQLQEGESYTYEFFVQEPMMLSGKALAGKYTAELRNAAGQLMATFTPGSTAAATISQILMPGSYTITARHVPLSGEAVWGNSEIVNVNMEAEVARTSLGSINGKVGMAGRETGVSLSVAAFDAAGNRITKDPLTGKDLEIDPDKMTWVVVHGRTQSSQSDPLEELAQQLSGVSGVDDRQVLMLDWSEGAADNSILLLEGANWIEPTADWVRNQIACLGINPQKINIVGFSWGGLMTYEIAAKLGRVNTVVALDPATDIPLVNNYNSLKVNYSAVANHSWTFDSSFPLGNSFLAHTAEYSFNINPPLTMNPETAHGYSVTLFNDLLRQCAAGSTHEFVRLFSLENLEGLTADGPTTRLGFEGEISVNLTKDQHSDGSDWWKASFENFQLPTD